MKGGRREAVPLIFLFLGVAVLFLDVLRGSNVFFARDVMHYYIPAKKILRDIVLAGEFPYWNSFFSAGQPMAANPEHEVFYPLTWLILLPDYLYAMQLLPLLHLFIAIGGMYALLRSMDNGRIASSIGAMSFGVGGMLCSLLTLYPCLFSIAWLPFTCLFTRRFLREHRWRDFAAASLFLGLQLLVAEPVTAIVSGLLLGCYAIHRGATEGTWHTIPKRVGSIGAISIAALLLAAVQALPAIDHLRDTGRGEGMTYDAVKTWSTPPIRFAEVLYPRVLGRFDEVGSASYWGGDLYPRKQTGFFYSIYGGLLIAVLALAGIFARVRGWALFLAIVVVAGLIAAGDFTPLLRMLHAIGLASRFRFPEKFLMAALFAVVVFGARVLDSLLRGEARTRKATLAVAAGTTALAFLAAFATSTSAYAAAFRALFRIDAMQAIEPSLAIARHEWLLAGARGIVLLLLLLAPHRLPRRISAPLLLAFVAIDLGTRARDVAMRLPASFFRETPPSVRAFPAQRDGFRIFHLAEWMESSPRAKAFRRPSDDYFWIRRNMLGPRLPAAYGLRTVIDGDFDETNLRATRDFSAAMFALAQNDSLQWIDVAASMSNVWYLGVYRRPEEAEREAGGWDRRMQPVQFVEGMHHPRYYFASRLVPVRDRDDFVRQLRAQRFPRDVAFVDGDAFAPASGTVHSWRESANGASIEVEAKGRAFLVMSVTPHKYWRVAIDGRETPSRVTNIGYQGVEVPAGRHLVEMRYRNPRIGVGGAVSLASLALFLTLLRRSESPR